MLKNFLRFRAGEGDHQVFQQAAEEEGMTLSAWVRRACLREAARQADRNNATTLDSAATGREETPMRSTAAALLIAFAFTAAAGAQLPPLGGAVDTCPAVTPFFTPSCAMPGGTCPTQAECDAGWLWMAPSHPVHILPVSWQREPTGQVGLVHCYTDTTASYAADKPACPGGSPLVLSLREFCARLRSFPSPPPAPGVTNLPVPSFSGICGAALEIPGAVKDTLAQAPTWREIGPGRAARLRQLSRWVDTLAR